jgi:polysaccharide pyruvyl transferase WcaK-like protein
MQVNFSRLPRKRSSYPKPVRIGLVTTMATNIGDDFIREGIGYVVRELLSKNRVNCVVVNKHRPHTVYHRWHPIRWCYDDDFHARQHLGPLRRMAQNWLPSVGLSRFDSCDMIIQCGTPIIWEGCRNSEWARLIWKDVLARLSRSGTPVLNIGGGSCYPWEKQPTTLTGTADEAFIRLMLNAASLTTVRDDLSMQLFHALGHRTQLISCPAILAGQIFATTAKPKRMVIVNYMRGGGHYDWGQRIDVSLWEATMSNLLTRLLQDGWEVLLLAHDESELAEYARLWPDLPRNFPATAKEYFETIRNAAFGIFNRMHASVAAAGMGIPSVAIGTDTRNMMVTTLGLPAFYVKDANMDKLVAVVDELIAHRSAESERLLRLREATLETCKQKIEPFVAAALARAASRGALHRITRWMPRWPEAFEESTLIAELEDRNAELQRICDERLAVIEGLQRTCDERLEVIEGLKRTCDERLALIEQFHRTRDSAANFG